jgi:hypothetical protein
MSISLTREHHSKSLDRLLVNGEPAAVVAPVVPEMALLFVSYYSEQWKWWAIVAGVQGGTWLVRNSTKPKDSPLVLEPGENPVVVKSSWDSPAPERVHINSKAGRRTGKKASA